MKTKIETIKKLIEHLKDEYYELKDEQIHFENECRGCVESGSILGADEAYETVTEIFNKCEKIKNAINSLSQVECILSGEKFREFLG